MMELDACKQFWRGGPDSPPTTPISKEELMAILQAKAEGIRERARERVRQEGLIYVAFALGLVVTQLTFYGARLKELASTLVVLALLGIVVAALAYKQYQLRTLPLGGSLRESLLALIATLDSTSRLYMAAYLACIAVGALAAEGFLFWRHGLTLLTALSLIVAAAFIVWCYRSGRGYLRRMFGHYRAELAESLQELEGA